MGVSSTSPNQTPGNKDTTAVLAAQIGPQSQFRVQPRGARRPAIDEASPAGHDWSSLQLLRISNRKKGSLDIAPIPIPPSAIPSPSRSGRLKDLGIFFAAPTVIQHAWWNAYWRWNYGGGLSQDKAAFKKEWAAAVPSPTEEEWELLCREQDLDDPNLGVRIAELFDKNSPDGPGELQLLQNSLWCPRRVGRRPTPELRLRDDGDSLDTNLNPFHGPVNVLQPVIRPPQPRAEVDANTIIWDGVSGHTFQIPTDPFGYFAADAPLRQRGPPAFPLEIRRVKRKGWEHPEWPATESGMALQTVRIGENSGIGEAVEYKSDGTRRTIQTVQLESVWELEWGNDWLRPGEMDRRRNESEKFKVTEANRWEGGVKGGPGWAEYLGERENDRNGFDYFVINTDLLKRFISVNGLPISYGEVAGPLPSFAAMVVEGGQVCFWWGVEGREYTPSRDVVAASIASLVTSGVTISKGIEIRRGAFSLDNPTEPFLGSGSGPAVTAKKRRPLQVLIEEEDEDNPQGTQSPKRHKTATGNLGLSVQPTSQNQQILSKDSGGVQLVTEIRGGGGNGAYWFQSRSNLPDDEPGETLPSAGILPTERSDLSSTRPVAHLRDGKKHTKTTGHVANSSPSTPSGGSGIEETADETSSWIGLLGFSLILSMFSSPANANRDLIVQTSSNRANPARPQGGALSPGTVRPVSSIGQPIISPGGPGSSPHQLGSSGKFLPSNTTTSFGGKIPPPLRNLKPPIVTEISNPITSNRSQAVKNSPQDIKSAKTVTDKPKKTLIQPSQRSSIPPPPNTLKRKFDRLEELRNNIKSFNDELTYKKMSSTTQARPQQVLGSHGDSQATLEVVDPVGNIGSAPAPPLGGLSFTGSILSAHSPAKQIDTIAPANDLLDRVDKLARGALIRTLKATGRWNDLWDSTTGSGRISDSGLKDILKQDLQRRKDLELVAAKEYEYQTREILMDNCWKRGCVPPGSDPKVMWSSTFSAKALTKALRAQDEKEAVIASCGESKVYLLGPSQYESATLGELYMQCKHRNCLPKKPGWTRREVFIAELQRQDEKNADKPLLASSSFIPVVITPKIPKSPRKTVAKPLTQPLSKDAVAQKAIEEAIDQMEGRKAQKEAIKDLAALTKKLIADWEQCVVAGKIIWPDGIQIPENLEQEAHHRKPKIEL